MPSIAKHAHNSIGATAPIGTSPTLRIYTSLTDVTLVRNHFRQKPRAETRSCQLDDEFHLASSSCDSWLKVQALAPVQNDATDGIAGLKQNEWQSSKAGQIDSFLTEQLMPIRQNSYQRFTPDFLPLEVVRYGKQRNGQINLAEEHLRFQVFATLLDKLDLDSREPVPITCENWCKDGPRIYWRKTQAESARLQATQVTKLSQQAIALGEDSSCSPVDYLTNLGGRDPMACPIDERGSELVLQLSHHFADC
jgi:hypothetical protein